MSTDEPLTLDLFGPSPDEGAPGDSGEAGEAEEPGAADELDAPGDRPGADAAEPPAAAETPAKAGSGDVAPRAPARESAAGAGNAAEPEVWTVSQVNRAVRTLLEGALKPLWVSGEVGGWTRARSGHRYFTLKDDQAQLRCVMWRADAARLPTDPDEGMEVRAWGSLTLYEARGEYQLVVRRLEAAGAEGLWRLAFEKLRQKLEAEGLLAAERKRPLPRFPACVGVVTSATGAAVRDVVTVIRRRAPWTRVVVRGCRVQGEGAAEEVAESIRCLTRSGLAQVLIVGRGGGSLEDLWAFNEEPVARAIAASPIPVISAVGHEVDVTIADLVADHRAATPSAGAEAAVQDGASLLAGLQTLPPRLSRALRACVRNRAQALDEGEARLERAMGELLRTRRELLDRRSEGLEQCMGRRSDLARQRLGALVGRLEALSPLSTLKRGYAVPMDEEGHVLREMRDFPPGREFLLRVADGRVRCEAGDAVGDVEEEGLPELGGAR